MYSRTIDLYMSISQSNEIALYSKNHLYAKNLCAIIIKLVKIGDIPIDTSAYKMCHLASFKTHYSSYDT